MDSNRPVPRPRESWVDVAKGMAILLVVLFHAVIFLNDVGLAGPWNPVTGVLDSFRMPLFFLTAGLFAAKALALPFAELFRNRIANLIWLYFLWSTIWALAFLVIPIMRPEGDLTPVQQFLLLAVWPNASTWFVYALALFFAVAWALRRLPLWLQLAPTVVLTLVFGSNLLNTGNAALDKMAIYFVFFLLAVNLSPLIRRVAGSVRTWHAVLLALIYLALAVLTARSGLFVVPGVKFFVSLVAVATGVSIAVALSRHAAFDWLRELGTRTLPIYVLHFYPILVVASLLAPFSELFQNLAPALPPVLAILAVVASLGIHRVTRRVRGVYALPRLLQRALLRPRPVRADPVG